jgi:hypothetical protein
MAGKRKVEKVRRDDSGAISHVLFKGNTRVTPLDQAVSMAERGEIDGVHEVQGKHLRSNPNAQETDNLQKLPDV